MNCPACGNAYQPGNRFCGRCGRALPVDNAAAADSPAAGMGRDAAAEPQFVPCPRCRQDNVAGAAWCFSCGAAFPAAPPAGPAGSLPPYAPSPASGGLAGERPAAFALGPPGGFWIRVLPYIIDRLIIPLPLILLWMMLGLPAPDFANLEEALNPPPAFRFLQITIPFLTLLYDTAFIALRGATPGKQLFGLYVVRANGSRVGWGRALARHLLTALILNLAVITVGLSALLFLVIAFHPHKRGLHDLICDTVVVRRDRREG